jgi:hypothetical protein
MQKDADVSRVVLWSRIGFALIATFIVTFARVPFLPAALALIVVAALGWPAMTWWVGRAAPDHRARALRHAALVCGPFGAAVALPIATLGQGIEFERATAMAPYVIVLGVVIEAFVDLAITPLVPAPWRASDKPMWKPKPEQRRKVLWGWVLGTWLVFELVTAATSSSDCFVDATCSYGAPARFLKYGPGGRSFEWPLFVADLVFFALLGVAAWGLVVSRLRVVFFFVVGGMLAWIGFMVIDAKGEVFSNGSWWVFELF